MIFVVDSSGGGSGGPSASDAILTVTVPTGSTVTATKGGVTLRPTMWVQAADPTLDCALFVISPSLFDAQNPWTVTATLGTNTASDTVTISANKQYDMVINYRVPAAYQEVEYLAVNGTSGPHIITRHTPTNNDEYEVTFQYTGVPDNNTWVFGSYAPNRDTMLGYYNNNIKFSIGGSYFEVVLNTDKHTFLATRTNMILDNVVKPVTPNWNNVAPYELAIFGTHLGSNNVTATKNVRIFRAKIWTGGDLVGDFIPCYQKSDSLPGMWDAAGKSFYTNSGSGTFLLGPDV